MTLDFVAPVLGCYTAAVEVALLLLLLLVLMLVLQLQLPCLVQETDAATTWSQSSDVVMWIF